MSDKYLLETIASLRRLKMSIDLKFQQAPKFDSASTAGLLIVGEKDALFGAKTLDLPQGVDFNAIAAPVKDDLSDKVTSFVKVADKTVQVSVITFKNEVTRHTGSIRCDLIPDLVSKNLPKDGNVVVKFVCKPDQVPAVTAAISRGFPKYNKKTGKADDKKTGRTLFVEFITGGPAAVDYAHSQRLSNAVRFCAELVDTPPSELHTDSYLDIVQQVVKRLPGVKLTVIKGTELQEKGFGGLWGVGKAATHLPALAILSYTPANSKYSSAWVGKGIVYDTGGLSIKGSTNMPTMKCDMGGSAAILCAFEAAVLGGYENTLHALLCLAENSVDANSTRPDDILYMYSGKTVEVNNTDAEGRLVLADGVAYASKHLKPDVILDMATLTGAQLVCTGERHAAILSSSEELEKNVYKAGQESGDWAFPLIYAPELLKSEFKSEVADMKNSVKSRSNAQSSCAGHFVEDHLDAEWKGKWVHVDIAGPSFIGGRGTGFGVSLLLQLLKLQK